MVMFKIAVVILVIIIGFFFFQDRPTGTRSCQTDSRGVLKGVSAVFYAYIGFDAISTTAEECTECAAGSAQGDDLFADDLYGPVHS